MSEQFHYPPEVFSLLVDVIPLLCRSKKDVIIFFQGAGVPPEDLSEVVLTLRSDPVSINKFEIARAVLTKTNARGDSGLAARREIIKRTVEFEEFSTCWPNDQLKAKGLVADLRKTVNVKDSFTRMKLERDAERERAIAAQRAEQMAMAKKRAEIDGISRRLSALFAMDDAPQERGKLLESVLNDLFRTYGISVREDFRRRAPDTNSVLEQIDGVVEIGGTIHLVEMKWLKAPVGMGEFAPHIARLFTRANANGIFIATNGYTDPVLTECRNALNLKTIFLCSLQEFVFLLQRQGDLIELLKKKSHAAIIEKNPFLEVLS
ncbi:restriction endonuclease [Arenimonas sp.]|uniref:restriction endonuclease n=1 Tax=Arenimonas sp. TaxID=1872635 RepID=UPI0025D9F4FD|nr:restriction endonuclease [Arenimonas sp.]